MEPADLPPPIRSTTLSQPSNFLPLTTERSIDTFAETIFPVTSTEWNLSIKPAFDDRQLEDLAKASGALTHLHICSANITASCLVRSFFCCPDQAQKLANLQGFCALDFPNSPDMHMFYKHLSTVAKGLRELYLNGKFQRSLAVTDQMLIDLINQNPNLKTVVLKNFRVTKQWMLALKAASQLMELKLMGCTIQADAEECFENLPIQILTIGNCNGVTDRTFSALTSCPALSTLYLGISLSIGALSKLREYPKLTSLHLVDCSLSAAELCPILPQFTQLRSASLEKTMFQSKANKLLLNQLRQAVQGRMDIVLLPEWQEYQKEKTSSKRRKENEDII